MLAAAKLILSRSISDTAESAQDICENRIYSSILVYCYKETKEI